LPASAFFRRRRMAAWRDVPVGAGAVSSCILSILISSDFRSPPCFLVDYPLQFRFAADKTSQMCESRPEPERRLSRNPRQKCCLACYRSEGGLKFVAAARVNTKSHEAAAANKYSRTAGARPTNEESAETLVSDEACSRCRCCGSRLDRAQATRGAVGPRTTTICSWPSSMIPTAIRWR
jgi:hypothetical protein